MAIEAKVKKMPMFSMIQFSLHHSINSKSIDDKAFGWVEISIVSCSSIFKVKQWEL
jgi:hypothetical protein